MKICKCGEQFARMDNLLGHIRHFHTEYDRMFDDYSKEYKDCKFTSNELKCLVRPLLRDYLSDQYKEWMGGSDK